ncbi:MAG: hypothetical protein M1825_002039 [Sarcosagium campestre]|nr:MAG: hypothetical protein M1825_002039 [Sarcosagium campestre]
MDVDKFNFNSCLLDILEAIAEAHFVAIDLELSGIGRLPNKPAPPSSCNAEEGKQSLQQRYMETKEAAERFQVLQFGLTCVQEHSLHSKYIPRTYNINVCPLVAERLDLDRVFSFQSGAISFLMGHGFQLDAPFKSGVPYLSRQEENTIRQAAADREKVRVGHADITLPEDDHEAILFVESVRNKIKEWEKQQPRQYDYINIAAADHDVDPFMSRGLNTFQKRLVHQLVRSEFPHLVTASKMKFIQILHYNEERESIVDTNRKNRLQEQIGRQTGIRWIVEAMIGGELSGMDVRWFTTNPFGQPAPYDVNEAAIRFGKVKARLRHKKTVLVGHNMLTDLVSFYHTFIGTLPDDVEVFKKIIHSIFPLVVDTKYLATHQCASNVSRSSLDELHDEIRNQTFPLFDPPVRHSKYLGSRPFHEAGYDSFVTAKIMVKLSAKLYPLIQPPTLREAEYMAYNTRSLLDTDMYEMQGPDQDLAVSSPPLEPTRLNGDGPVAHVEREAGLDEIFLGLADQGDSWEPPRLPPNFVPAFMPFLHDPFWSEYGNKLRVFGTGEALLDLD